VFDIFDENERQHENAFEDEDVAFRPSDELRQVRSYENHVSHTEKQLSEHLVVRIVSFVK